MGASSGNGGNVYDTQPMPVESAPVEKRGAPRWSVGLIAVLLLANTAGLGYLLYRNEVETTRVSKLSKDLDASRGLISQLQTEIDAAEVAVSGAQELASGARELASGAQDVAEQAAREQKEAKDASLDTNAVVEKAEASVVTVRCGDGLGSGFAIKASVGEGYDTAIITNYHVVEECIYVGGPEAFASRGSTEFPSRLWNWDAANDLAILFISAGLPPLEPAPVAKVGDPVVAIGSPYGLEGTVTTGIISRIEDNWYQTSAPINPGNSGGPLLDRQARVLGINTLGIGGGGSGIAGSIRLQVTCEGILEDC